MDGWNVKKLWVLEGRLSLRGLRGVEKSKQERRVKVCEMSRRDDNEWKGGNRGMGLGTGWGRGDELPATEIASVPLGI